jgi:hypothetical protein
MRDSMQPPKKLQGSLLPRATHQRMVEPGHRLPSR